MWYKFRVHEFSRAIQSFDPGTSRFSDFIPPGIQIKCSGVPRKQRFFLHKRVFGWEGTISKAVFELDERLTRGEQLGQFVPPVFLLVFCGVLKSAHVSHHAVAWPNESKVVTLKLKTYRHIRWPTDIGLISLPPPSCSSCSVQGYLAHKKQPPICTAGVPRS